jgi:hypothetical protein
MPEITCAAILDDELGSTKEERKVKIIAPPMTMQCVLIPAALFLDSLSNPMAKPAASEMPMPTRKRISYPVGMPSNTIQLFSQRHDILIIGWRPAFFGRMIPHAISHAQN